MRVATWPVWVRATAIAGVVVVVLAIALGAWAWVWFRRDVPQTYANIQDHFKYGSIGAEAGAGIPYWVWTVLPDVFPEYLPDRPGTGYERVGLIYESPQSERPIGTGYRERPIGLVGLNCAACHAGAIQEAPDAPRQIVLGMPAHDFDLQAYARFLFAAGNDDRFNAGVLMPAIDRLDPDLSPFQRLLYRYLVIPRTRDALRRQSQQFAWMDRRPPSGPGRVDTFNPFNAFFGLDPGSNDIVGTADLPSLWHQKVRSEMHLHWDGNNNSVDERNINAAVGAGAIEGMQDRIDLDAIQRIAEWEWDQVDPPPFPSGRIDQSRAEPGRAVYKAHCASCHSLDGAYVGQVTDISEIGTDRERLDSFTGELVVYLNQTGAGKPWAYSHFKKTNGYANSPLDGIWLRGPYLHNGSVPTIEDLLKPPAQRPTKFYTGYDVLDFDRVGFVSSGPGAEQNGVLFDTTVRGNGNGGHVYGTDLTDAEKRDLIEFLKTQ
ncbi:MAG: c-type cytochrome [Chloroflexi bacterium]|nr:c-type cytochrome [Chloroflexota bacterium]